MPMETSASIEADDRRPDLLKGGLIRRIFALLVDLFIAELLVQLVAAVAFPLSGGWIVDTNSIYTSCFSTEALPTGIDVPPDYRDAKAQICVKSLLGLPTARTIVLARRDPSTNSTVSVSYNVDSRQHVMAPFDLGQLQIIVVALMRWGLERKGWRSPGRKWLSLKVEPKRRERTMRLSQRYILFALPIVPALVVQLFETIFGSVGGQLAPDLVSVLYFLENLPATVALVAAAAAIARKRDAFYDEAAGTTTARLVDGQVVVASEQSLSLIDYFRRERAAVGRAVVSQKAVPWLSCALAFVLVVTFAAELTFASRLPAATGFGTVLVLFGAMDGELVRQVGQWYRLATAIFLHINLAHLIANVVVLLAAGWFLEGVLGRGWLFAIFLLGGLAGSAASIAFNPSDSLALGASGAVTAVIAAGLIVSGGLADDARRLWMRAFCVACLLAALQASGKFAWGTVDRADHFGGAMAGALLGGVVLAVWKRGESQAPGQLLAPAVAVAVALALFISVPLAGFGDAPMSALLIPDGQLPRSDAEWAVRSTDLVHRYPSDWRGYVALADAAGDNKGEREHEMSRAIDMALHLGANRAQVEAGIFKSVGANRENARDWPAALDLFGRAIGAMPDDADALAERGFAELALGQVDDALKDMQKARQINPQSAAIDIRLSDVLFAAGQPSEALSALDAALSLAPNNQLAVRQRGWIEFFDKRGDASLRDLERARDLDNKDAYTALWLDIVAARLKQGDRMRSLVGTLDMTVWPAPVLKLYLGDNDVDALMQAAEATADPVKKDDQRCEAAFYAGEWEIIQGASNRAAPLIQAAVAGCPKTFYELPAAVAEQARQAGSNPHEGTPGP